MGSCGNALFLKFDRVVKYIISELKDTIEFITTEEINFP